MTNSLVVAVVVLACAVYVTNAGVGDTFTVNCQPLSMQRSDPIVYPGVAGAHVHSIIGGNAFRRNMPGTFDARDAKVTTCDKSQDHSNYWVPHLYHYRTQDNMWEMVKWIGSAIYYQKRACNYSPNAKSCDPNFVPQAPPDGLRMLSGNPYKRTFNASGFADQAISYMCLYNGGSQYYNGFPHRQCDMLRAQVYFPSCWDGKNVDSADHASHMAFPVQNYNGGVCPQSHPVAIFSVFYEFDFITQPYTDVNRFALACGDATGYGFHGDYMFGWTNRTSLQNAHRDCVSASDCPTLGSQPAQAQPLIYPAIYEEPIGLDKPIKTLPGNNPVVWAEPVKYV